LKVSVSVVMVGTFVKKVGVSLPSVLFERWSRGAVDIHGSRSV